MTLLRRDRISPPAAAPRKWRNAPATRPVPSHIALGRYEDGWHFTAFTHALGFNGKLAGVRVNSTVEAAQRALVDELERMTGSRLAATWQQSQFKEDYWVAEIRAY